MPQPSSKLAADLRKRLTTLERSRRQIEAQASAGNLSQVAVSQLYESLYLNAHKLFESFLEDLFIGLLVENKGYYNSRATPRVAVRDFGVARDIVRGRGSGFVDWLPYDRTVGLARVFFRGGRPFAELEKSRTLELQKTVVLRNAIAHRSRHSQDRFRAELLSGISLAPRQRNPAGFLRDTHASSPRQTRYELMVAQLQRCASELCA